jgi:hypothetical protein
MRHDVAEENHTGYGHNDLFADGGFIEADDPIHGIDRNCTHAEVLGFLPAGFRAARNSLVGFKL